MNTYILGIVIKAIIYIYIYIYIKALKSMLYYAINIICLLKVSATCVAILKDMHYKGYITTVFEPMRTCKILCFKIYG
jgi:hypothetical protein